VKVMYESKRSFQSARTVAIAVAMAGTLWSQTAPTPAFDAASVKLSAPLDAAAMMSGRARLGIKIDAGRIDIANTSLFDVIVGAYRLKDYQLSGPDWLKAVRVDIVGTLPKGTSQDDIPEMLQSLLAERFGLKIHRETKEHPEYALVVAKGGSKLKEAVEDPEHPAVAVDPKAADFGLISRMSNSQMSGDPAKGMVISGLPQGGTMRVSFGGAGLHIESSSATMRTLADDLTQYLDRPVMDKTGLTKHYQVALDVSMADMMNFMSKQSFPGGGGPPPGGFGGGFGGGPGGGFGGGGTGGASAGDSEPAGASILASLQQLGLKLDTQKAPIEVVVVDHLEKTPLEN
jgi:uncharacterized protein (TIGR03435 family)